MGAGRQRKKENCLCYWGKVDKAKATIYMQICLGISVGEMDGKKGFEDWDTVRGGTKGLKFSDGGMGWKANIF